MGMAVQRSTFLFWDKQSLKNYTQAISWQDSRAQKENDRFLEHSDIIQKLTGVPLNSHFGAPKYLHFVESDPQLKERCENDKVWFGTLSSYLAHSFTGHPAIDESIAGRSLLMNLDEVAWDNELCSLFDIPKRCLPPITPTVHDYGIVEIDEERIPLRCVIGDQQAALIGQGGHEHGTIAMNFGTSGSVQFNAGNSPTRVTGLLSNVLFSNNTDRNYLLEGTITSCSSMFYWLENKLDISHKNMKWDKRCEKCETEGILIPGFAGIAAPYWIDGFEDIYFNLDNSSNDEMIRSAMETIGFLVHDIYRSIVKETKINPQMITASGGGAREPLLQFIADLLQIKIGHTTLKDRTALGVYKLLCRSNGHATQPESVECDKIFTPQIESNIREKKLQNWKSAINGLLT
jgi:glycerol kinase